MGFVKLLPGSGTVLALSMGFLDSDDVVVVKEFFNGLLLGFPAGFRKAFSGEEAVSVPSGKREGGGVIGQDSVRVFLARWELLGVLVAGGVPTGERVTVGSCQRVIAIDFLV